MRGIRDLRCVLAAVFLLAPVGQASLQEPQSRQAPASMTYWSSPWLIAPAGQASAQAPQLTQAELM